MKTKFLSFLIIIFSFSSLINAQESEESSVVSVPESAMQEIVRRILIYNFKSRIQEKTIYLRQKGIKQDWLPKIENVEFQLLTEEEIEDKGVEVYFFTEPEKSNATYEIGFAYGDPSCHYLGKNSWKFRISNSKVRLWVLHNEYGFGGGCVSSGSSGEFESPGEINKYPNELSGYKFFDSGKLGGLKFTISTKEDVKNNFGIDCEYSCDYDDNWKVRFSYFGSSYYEKTVDGKKTKFVAKDELVGKLSSIVLTPRSTILFNDVVFPPSFRKYNIFSAGHDGKGGGTSGSHNIYKDRYGLEYNILEEISLTTVKDLKWQKGQLQNIEYTLPKKLEENVFVEEK